MELFPIQILFLVVLMNRYILGPLMRRVRGDQFDATNDAYEPTVAIIIPLFNEGEGIYHAIRSLLLQDYPPDKLSIVVVDDCSKDDSYVWALKAAEQHPNVMVMRNPENMGKRKGINRGVRATQSEIIVSVDSDVIVDRGAVRQLVRRFLHPRIAAVGGRTYVTNRHQNWMTRMIEIKFHFAQEWLKDLERGFRSVMCLSGCLTAYRRHVLEELEPILEARSIAGVAIKYGEDRFLTRQIIKAGYETIYTTAAVCFTATPANIAGYFAQQLRWRRSNLVDMLGGLSHAWRLHPVVAVHYVSQFGLLLSYPVVIVHNILTGEFWDILAMHVLTVGIMGFIYRWETRHLPDDQRVPGLSFLPMALMMPITYALFTPLALLTLDSGSWETRGAPAASADTPAPSDTSLMPAPAAEGLST
ncbi:glycosyltransferase family 2 protein [Stigmatella aurantiaca]|uniref:Chitin synthase n=1 Tax=Stigmatella aurantiaca (strain DW4/3-1) TaxID=378806 RepID=Q08TW3_STIAD|nr:glycosyltransferase [Stigmatella aurantiaca]ADO71797.1 Glycosyl transferase, group 2 [Stigmatella aurantiaca DW4/3-1]EAU63920.1 chitin synthase [Stigmatella aurantiaca DW4/3-1]